MTNHVVRLYTASAAIIVFFVAWAGIAARPWVTPAPDPQVAALAQRQQRLRTRPRLQEELAVGAHGVEAATQHHDVLVVVIGGRWTMRTTGAGAA